MDTGHNESIAGNNLPHTHTAIQHGQFKDASKPQMHDFGQGKKTPEARGEPQTPEVWGKCANH